MLSEKMESALNEQINKEMFSAYLYMSMSNKAASMGLKGTASWFMVQYHEEMVHAMKFYEYVQRSGGEVMLETIAKPDSDFSSVLSMFEKTLKHERLVTSSINELMEIAISDKDHATQAFLSWYVTEQVEEEETPQDIIQKLKLIGENTGALYMFDKELGARAVHVPTDFSQGVEAAMGG
ncbi:MAG: ferritin [Chitinispirillaceae bacterium]